MGEMQRNARTLDKKRPSRGFEAPKSFDALKQNYETIADPALSKKNDQEALKNSRDVIDCIIAKTDNIVESRYGFSKKIQELEQKKIVERKELEKQIENLKTGMQLSLCVKLLKEAKSDKNSQLSQILDGYRHRNFLITPEGYKKKRDDLIQKFATSQKDKDESIKKLENEKSAYQKQYMDLLFGLYKSSSIIESAKQLEEKKFRHDMIVATTAYMNIGGIKVGGSLGKFIENLIKSVVEGKL